MTRIDATTLFLSMRAAPEMAPQIEARSESAFVPHVEHSDYDGIASVFGKMENIADVGEAFERLARPLAFTLTCMRRARPDVMAEPFDLVSHRGILSVVDTKLGAEDRAWIEQVLNAGGSLGRLADGFNQQVVRSYDTDHGIRSADGTLIGRQAFDDPKMPTIDYAGLSDTVDDSVKLMSLLHDVETTSLTGWRSAEHPYRMGGWLVQRYIQGEITEYVPGPNGVETLRSTRGYLLRNDIWW
ncbi:hypothetical protein BJI69_02815 [Luteibacter rhizovicinus DSM 16549]|uniref:Uncharacterized protein n=1 Tax=Luteibacter rhizovicinus DSM 16549 TaxID=1440763 RepID=A0A0G9H1B1_9GAMM|nr:hypothetical protein [Luteibacter rhizovicinus]APG02944.1 hypothetical protein BJI69_02815 [Luteibacter rhizovicinus DSM 16549]KLD63333.1 hypothetical protein Y883_19500 [Luteibacter rhizovicinus DSM 16549]KLD76482.1 hypothetical protein Y886_21075 [Xanthomonas hyacinthi DSM 19077]